MTVKECYAAMGGNYDEVMSRLRTEERVTKFLLRVTDDPSYKTLCDSLASHDLAEAFRASHTIKGICLNLSLTKLYDSAQALTELLRGRTDYGSDIDPLFDRLKKDYETTMNAINQLK